MKKAELKKHALRTAIIFAEDAGVLEDVIKEIIEKDPGYNWDLEMVMLPFHLAIEEWRNPPRPAGDRLGGK